jgi:hypothetical protein
MFLRKYVEWNFKGIKTFEVGMAFVVKGDDLVLPKYSVLRLVSVQFSLFTVTFSGKLT